MQGSCARSDVSEFSMLSGCSWKHAIPGRAYDKKVLKYIRYCDHFVLSRISRKAAMLVRCPKILPTEVCSSLNSSSVMWICRHSAYTKARGCLSGLSETDTVTANWAAAVGGAGT